MPAQLSAALDALAARWAALTPVRDAARPYRRIDTQLQVPDGTSAVNVFWFELPGNASLVAMTGQGATVEWQIVARCRMTLAGLSIAERQRAPTDRVVQLLMAANAVTPPPGTRSIRCTGAGPHEILVDTDEDGNEITAGDLDLVLSLVIRTEETNL